MTEEKQLTDLARDERNDYARTWRRNNKDKVKEINRRYWEKKAREKLADRANERTDGAERNPAGG